MSWSPSLEHGFHCLSTVVLLSRQKFVSMYIVQGAQYISPFTGFEGQAIKYGAVLRFLKILL